MTRYNGRMRVCRLRRGACATAVLVCFVCIGADVVRPGVGDVARAPRSFRYVGCEAFTPAEIAAALEADLDVQLASAPSAPVESYLPAVQSAVTAGYLKAGYLTAKATVEPNPASRTIMVTVAEGPKSTCGPIRVTGARTLPVDKLISKLTSERPAGMFPQDFNPRDGSFRLRVNLAVKDPDPPVWKTGEPVAGDRCGVETLRDAVRRACCELGYFEAWTETRFATEASPCALEINVRSEGPRALLEAVDIQGARKNPPERVAELIGLEVGKPLDLEQLRQAQQRLWEAARFTEHTVTAEPRRGDPSRMRVRVDLREYDEAPPLGQPFSPIEQAALKFRDWAAGIRDREDELVATVRFPTVQVDLALGHRRGFVVRAGPVGADGAGGVGVFATDSEIGLCGAGLVFRSALPSSRFYIDLAVGAEPDPKPGREWSMGVNFGTTNIPKLGAAPLELRPALAPVAFIHFVHGREPKLELRDGVLAASGPRIRKLAIDAATGRLLELQFASEDGGQVASLTVRKGAVDEVVASLQRGTRNAYDPAAPTASALRFLVIEALHARRLMGEDAVPKERVDSAAAAAMKLLTNDALSPMETVAASLLRPFRKDVFQVPMPPPPEMRGPAAYSAAAVGLPPIDDLFPRGSWPWTLARLALLIPAGEYRGATEEVSRLLASDDVGPLGYLAAAELLARVNPDMAPPFARRGLQRLDAKWFDKDLDQLLGEGLPPGVVLARLAANLRGLSTPEVEALAAALPAPAAERVRQLSQELRRQPDAPPPQLLRAALRAAWSAELRGAVEARLQALRQGGAARP
jgi:hypothetical protein